MFCRLSIDKWRLGSRLWSCQMPNRRWRCRRRRRRAERRLYGRRQARSINIRSVCLFSLYGQQIQSNLRRSNGGGDRRRPRGAARCVTDGQQWRRRRAFFLLNLLRLSGDRVPISGASVLSRAGLRGRRRRKNRQTAATHCRYGFLDILYSVAASFVTAEVTSSASAGARFPRRRRWMNDGPVVAAARREEWFRTG